jgi:hypothetical protein
MRKNFLQIKFLFSSIKFMMSFSFTHIIPCPRQITIHCNSCFISATITLEWTQWNTISIDKFTTRLKLFINGAIARVVYARYRVIKVAYKTQIITIALCNYVLLVALKYAIFLSVCIAFALYDLFEI